MGRERFRFFAFTKAFAMDGWRLGYLHAPQHMIASMLKISMNDITHVNTFIQYDGLAALTTARDSVIEMVDDDCAKRHIVVERLNAMYGVQCAVPDNLCVSEHRAYRLQLDPPRGALVGRSRGSR
jgi:aspartate aminotransferase